MSVVNHVGLAVSDLARSRAFYEDALGFEFKSEMTVPDGATTKMFALEGPLDTGVVYLQRDGWVLELLSFARMEPRRDRAINELGLTHISVSVDDMEATCARIVDLGGEVLTDQSFPGIVVMARDPDGQMLELLPMSYRDTM